MSRLIAFGCSNTYGQGLPDCHIKDRTGDYRAGPHPSKHAWPSLLGKLLERETVNLAQPGGSNKHIWYNVVNYDFQETDIVVLHWTFLYRSAILWKDKPPLHLGLWDIPEPNIGEAYKKFVTVADSDYDKLIETLVYIDHANKYLQNKVKGVININFNPGEFKDLPNWIDFEFDLTAAPFNVDYPLALDGKHTGLQGHRAFAKSIFKIIAEKYKCWS